MIEKIIKIFGITKIIENFNNNDLFHNNILKNEIPHFSLSFNKIFNKKFWRKNNNSNSSKVQTKFNAQSEFGNEIMIIGDINNKAKEA